MKKVTCKDINPDSTCNFEATGDTTKDVVNKMLMHAKKEHPEDLEGMTDAEARAMIETRVTDA